MRESANYITVINEHGDAVFHEDKQCDGVMDDARLIAAAPSMYELLAMKAASGDDDCRRLLEEIGDV